MYPNNPNRFLFSGLFSSRWSVLCFFPGPLIWIHDQNMQMCFIWVTLFGWSQSPGGETQACCVQENVGRKWNSAETCQQFLFWNQSAAILGCCDASPATACLFTLVLFIWVPPSPPPLSSSLKKKSLKCGSFFPPTNRVSLSCNQGNHREGRKEGGSWFRWGLARKWRHSQQQTDDWLIVKYERLRSLATHETRDFRTLYAGSRCGNRGFPLNSTERRREKIELAEKRI